MKKPEGQKYFVGLDVGTDSVGYAVTDKEYKLLKHKGEPMWGVHLFEEANLCDERRAFRTARRRLDRRQQRVKLVQELFAAEIAKIDPNFYVRIKESALYAEDTTLKEKPALFRDQDYTDAIYHRQYPTIHHLISDLMENSAQHDVRLVYLACAWLVAHRGHFLSELSKENIAQLVEIKETYEDFMGVFGEMLPWSCNDSQAFGEILKKQASKSEKYKALCMLLYGMPKAPKGEEFDYDRDLLIKMLCGSKVSAKQLFNEEEYSDLGSFSLDMNDDDLAQILSALGDNADLVVKAKALYDWSVLNDILQGQPCISKAKVTIYERHQKDLEGLKYLVKKYVPRRYGEMFREESEKRVSYAVYSKSSSKKQEEFCKYVKTIIKDIVPEPEDQQLFQEIMSRAETQRLCPKQVNSDNRVIPYQAYWVELKTILENASKYLPFLQEKEDGYTVAEKILTIFEFRVPYFVGPLNAVGNDHAWIKRKAEGKIYPWNFTEKVDLEASEQAFIDRMTNSCTYLPGDSVLPKNSLCYEKFEVLNEINTISVNGIRIPAEVKQRIYSEMFLSGRKVTKKRIAEFLKNNNYYKQEDLSKLSGIDETIKSSLSSYRAFANLMDAGILNEQEVEDIIERRTYTESKSRFLDWLGREYPQVSKEDAKYICSVKLKNFGRLSRRLLQGIHGAEHAGSGEAMTILERMWCENLNLNEILSDKYSYGETIEKIRREYFGASQLTLEQRLQEMYVSNAVKRPILRTLDIMGDIVKATGNAPEKIFIEMARGGKEEERGKRTKSRYDQVMAIYSQCEEDVRELKQELESMGESVESRLQSDKLFLYYMQMGRCMYTGEIISLAELGSKLYDIDHIYPQSKIKDDSVLNNKVLVLSTANAEKGDKYPISSDVRHRMGAWWWQLKEKGLIEDEKYKRLTRSTPFSEEEQWGFINRQLVETRQSTKALASIMGELYPESQIVYVKAGLVSEFRQEFDMLKTRSVNDLHHAKDAYLNIVVGNVYNERFTRKWFLEHRDEYNLKVKKLLGERSKVKGADGEEVWNGETYLHDVKETVHKNNAIHLTRYATCKKGGFFDQMPVAAAPGLVPIKTGERVMSTEKYGGYNKPAATFFTLVRYTVGKKTDIMIMPVELLHADKMMESLESAIAYAKDNIGRILGKEITSVSFPLGLRRIKIGTVVQFDNAFCAYVTGKASGGKLVLLSTFSPLILGYRWEKYIKHLERFIEKRDKNPRLIYSEKDDKITTDQNMELYDVLIYKLSETVFSKRPAAPVEALSAGRERFEKLDVGDQARVLIQILLLFSRNNNGSDLEKIGGVAKAGVSTMSSSLSNWKKKYNSIRIIDSTASGLYMSKTENLLELL